MVLEHRKSKKLSLQGGIDVKNDFLFAYYCFEILSIVIFIVQKVGVDSRAFPLNSVKTHLRERTLYDKNNKNIVGKTVPFSIVFYFYVFS